MIENINVIVGIVGGVLVILGGYTTLVYKIAILTSTLNENTKLIIDVRNIVVNQDERVDKIDLRLTKLETQHEVHHGEERKTKHEAR